MNIGILKQGIQSSNNSILLWRAIFEYPTFTLAPKFIPVFVINEQRPKIRDNSRQGSVFNLDNINSKCCAIICNYISSSE